MIVHGPGCFELAKMAVKPEKRGRGYGDFLMKAAIDWARVREADKVILLSNVILEPTISLYHKHGFETVHLGEPPDYERCNIEMQLFLEEKQDEVTEKMLERVRKLLALATSSNEHEALLAMNRVREIYARYNLDQAQSSKDANAKAAFTT